MMRPRIGRRMVRTAAVGGAAYMAGSHVATKSMQNQQQEAAQNAQITDLQQQQATMAQAQGAPTQYEPTQYAPTQYAPPPPTPEPVSIAAPTPEVATTPSRDPIQALKELGELKAAGVLTDDEFAAKKAQLLAQI